jgi:hypothetical protein
MSDSAMPSKIGSVSGLPDMSVLFPKVEFYIRANRGEAVFSLVDHMLDVHYGRWVSVKYLHVMDLFMFPS